MAEHYVEVEVQAPLHQVYLLFTHFNDFPKFMRFVKEVTYQDDQRSHWVVQLAGRHEWDALNEGWIPDRQIGWRSIDGLENRGVIAFQKRGERRTAVDVYISYVPPLGVLGQTAETLSVGEQFDRQLREDLERFAQMVEQVPEGVEDPMFSRYLFNNESAVGSGTITQRQDASMQNDPMMSEQSLRDRHQRVEQQEQEIEAADRARDQQEQQVQKRQRAAEYQQRTVLQQQAVRNQQERDASAARAEQEAQQKRPDEDEDPELINVRATLGSRGASIANTSLGDMDSLTERYPGYERDPMMARATSPDAMQEEQSIVNPDVAQKQEESGWSTLLRRNPRVENDQDPTQSE